MTPVLDVKNLSVDLPTRAGAVHAVRDVSFAIAPAETFCLVGESGCGKSMTSLALMGLLPKGASRRAARLALSGQSLQDLTNREMADIRGARMAMIFQEPMTSLNPSFTIGDQLMEAMRRHRKVSRAEARERAVELLRKMGITAPENRLRQYPHQLSGGLRQRIMIAMAMMCGPALIIADEPTTALDVTIQAQILKLLQSLQDEFGLAIMLVTHDLGVVSRMADTVAVMYAGQIVESGSAAEIFGMPRHPYTRGLIACLPSRAKRDGARRLASIPGTVPALLGEIRGCAFRDRCPMAIERCSGPIDEQQFEASHKVRCIRAAELAAAVPA